MKVMAGIALAALMVSGSAFADNVFKCRDANGKTIYSGIPCDGQKKVLKTYTSPTGIGKSSPSPTSSSSRTSSQPVSRARTIRCTSNFASGSDCEYVK